MQTISNDLKAAMKAKDKETTNVLRMILSELKYAMTDGNREESLDDDTALKVLLTYHKRLDKSLADYPEGEQRQQIKSEMAIVERYLPRKADASEIDAAIEKLLGETEERNFGVLMKTLMANFGVAADGKMLSQKLKQKLEA